jgi:hypothetical protein
LTRQLGITACKFFLCARGTLPIWEDCRLRNGGGTYGGKIMNGLIYLVGLVVVILAVLSFFGLR